MLIVVGTGGSRPALTVGGGAVTGIDAGAGGIGADGTGFGADTDAALTTGAAADRATVGGGGAEATGFVVLGATGGDTAGATGVTATAGAGAASGIDAGAAGVGFGAGAVVGVGVRTGGGVTTTGATATVVAASEIDAGATGVGFGSGGGAEATGLGVVGATGAAGVTAFRVSTIAAPVTGAAGDEDWAGTGAGTGSVFGSGPAEAAKGPRTTLSICAAGTMNVAPDFWLLIRTPFAPLSAISVPRIDPPSRRYTTAGPVAAWAPSGAESDANCCARA